MVECSRGVVQFICLIALCFVGIPIWLEAPIRLPPGLVQKQFQNFITKYNKSYGDGQHPEEFQKRLAIFTDTLNHISEMNAQRGKQIGSNIHQLSAKYGITPYSDLTEDEFLSLHLNKHIALRLKMNQSGADGRSEDSDKATDADTDGPLTDYEKYNYVYADKKALEKSLPVKVDWRDKGYIPAVRRQGMCGACWAYSVITNIEAMLAKDNGTTVLLSTQQMIDCAENGNRGCIGGDTCELLDWLSAENVKIETELEYPALDAQRDSCKSDPNPTEYYQITGFSCSSHTKNELEILQLLANHGPVTVAVNALLWQHYLGGIIQYHCDGSIPNLNHAVIIVGYDRTGPIPYYIVQNSWGSEYGDNGYVRIEYGKNVCGIANQVAVVRV